MEHVDTSEAISGKMRPRTNSAYVSGRSGAQLLFAQAGVDLHHLAADLQFAHVALLYAR